MELHNILILDGVNSFLIDGPRLWFGDRYRMLPHCLVYKQACPTSYSIISCPFQRYTVRGGSIVSREKDVNQRYKATKIARDVRNVFVFHVIPAGSETFQFHLAFNGSGLQSKATQIRQLGLLLPMVKNFYFIQRVVEAMLYLRPL
jgi:hypothetical protein